MFKKMHSILRNIINTYVASIRSDGGGGEGGLQEAVEDADAVNYTPLTKYLAFHYRN